MVTIDSLVVEGCWWAEVYRGNLRLSIVRQLHQEVLGIWDPINGFSEPFSNIASARVYLQDSLKL